MMYAPFIEASDDQLSQLAQLQIFLTLLSSLSLRATPPSEFVSNLVTIVLFAVPLLGLALETPLLEVLGEAKAKLGELIMKVFPNLKPPVDDSLLNNSTTALKDVSIEDPATTDRANTDRAPAAGVVPAFSANNFTPPDSTDGSSRKPAPATAPGAEKALNASLNA